MRFLNRTSSIYLVKMLTLLILTLTILSNPTIELESLYTKTTEYLSIDDLKNKYHQLEKEYQIDILLALIDICKFDQVNMHVANASITSNKQNDLLNITAFFQGNRLIIRSLPVKEIKSFILSEINLDF